MCGISGFAGADAHCQELTHRGDPKRTNIATEAVVRAPPDGYTLFLVTPANAISATLYDNLNFNFIRDVTPVASFVRVPFVMVVNASFRAKTVPEFIAYAKANPGNIGTPKFESCNFNGLSGGV
jgi:Tripartite tricarboxylate transporter family receptor